MDEHERRSAFRRFVRSHHPDVGGDPASFAAGVAFYRSDAISCDDPRLTADVVFRRTRHGPMAVVDRLVRRYEQRRRPPRVR